MCSCMLARGIGSREGAHGAPLPSPGWPRQEGRTVHTHGTSHPAAEPRTGRGSLRAGVLLSQLQPVKMLSWR